MTKAHPAGLHAHIALGIGRLSALPRDDMLDAPRDSSPRLKMLEIMFFCASLKCVVLVLGLLADGFVMFCPLFGGTTSKLVWLNPPG